jgi:Predicted Zn-dependent protease
MGYYFGNISSNYFLMDMLLLFGMLLLPLIAHAVLNSTFRKYSNEYSSRGLTAEQAARKILDNNGLYHIRIERVSGSLSDYYSSSENVIRLSDSTYGKTSIAAIGVAAHECGHACQYAENYAPMILRNKVAPVMGFCSRFWYIAFILGCFFTFLPFLMYVGIAMFCAVVLFQLITLPMELDASHRALKTLEADAILESSEISPARKVLTAAAMTYVVSLATSAMQLIRLLLRARR